MHQVFQYIMFDLSQNEGEFISSNAAASVGLEDCGGEGWNQEVKKESWEGDEKGLVEKGQREWEDDKNRKG